MVHGQGSSKTGTRLKAGLAGIGILLFACSCTTVTRDKKVTVHPTRTPQYQFVADHSDLEDHRYELYVQEPNPDDDIKVQLALTQPATGFLAFHGGRNKMIDLTAHREFILTMEPGVYPFELRDTQDPDSTTGSGAMFVYNVDNTLSLATLGRTRETTTLAREALGEAANGKMAYYTLNFDDKPVLSYYLGDRTDLFVGGKPTAQLDFSENRGISKLTIDGKEQDGYSVVLPVFTLREYRTASQQKRQRRIAAEYKFEMTCGTTTYRGFLHLLEADEYTAFVKLDCTIPAKLLARAREGTVAKYTIQNAEGEEMAKLFLSEKTN